MADGLAGKAAVECRGVKKRYGSGATAVSALRGVDLTVKQGEVMMLVGPSGCGKTTLISTITGVLDASEGECLVLGKSISAMPEQARVRFRGKHIGFVFQQFHLVESLSARENVAVPLLLNGWKYGAALREADAALARVGLGERTHSYPRQLSGGQQQRVAVARAMVHAPDLIVCDEPTSALDHATGQQVMELLRRVTVEQGRALIVVTHDSRIFPYSDRIARMDDGAVEAVYGSYAEMVEQEKENAR